MPSLYPLQFSVTPRLVYLVSSASWVMISLLLTISVYLYIMYHCYSL